MNKSILVVDDNLDILDSLRFVLEGEGYTVTTTEKGEYAENLPEKKGDLPKLIILDFLLSGKDGTVICKRLKSNAVTKHIPILMISAHPDAEKLIHAGGADDFLAKPFDITNLLDKVEKYFKRAD